jgi:hypothetical protein
MGCTGATGPMGPPGESGTYFSKIGRIDSQSLSAVIDGVRYVWHGCYTTILSSEENGLKKGDIRFIGDVLFVVVDIHNADFRWWGLKRSRPNIVCWGRPGPSVDRPWLNELQRAIFLKF